jgi:hypothetical protein
VENDFLELLLGESVTFTGVKVPLALWGGIDFLELLLGQSLALLVGSLKVIKEFSVLSTDEGTTVPAVCTLIFRIFIFGFRPTRTLTKT